MKKIFYFVIVTSNVVLIVLFSYAGYRWNHGTSYPTGLYQIQSKTQVYTKGELILFCPPNVPILQEAVKRHYLNWGICAGGFEPVIKKIFGITGDKITFTHTININNSAIPHTHRFKQDSQHRLLPQLHDFIVSPQHVFLLSDHEPMLSFDSRYYGAVSTNNIIGIIKPIMVFKHD